MTKVDEWRALGSDDTHRRDPALLWKRLSDFTTYPKLFNPTCSTCSVLWRYPSRHACSLPLLSTTLITETLRACHVVRIRSRVKTWLYRNLFQQGTTCEASYWMKCRSTLAWPRKRFWMKATPRWNKTLALIMPKAILTELESKIC